MELFGMKGWEARAVSGHEGGRNLLYFCQSADAAPRVLRAAFLPDRTKENILAEAEFIRYLRDNGASVADAFDSAAGNLVEEMREGGTTFYVCAFEKAKGIMLVENGYRYREGVPLSEYFFNCGRTLGKIHALSKAYRPAHRRWDFFDMYAPDKMRALVPESMPRLAEKMASLMDSLRALDKSPANYGLIHYDFNDGNYNIDYADGRITVYDFDNACTCWYMYDLADVWTHGVGWVQFEPDPAKRKAFMDEYFDTVLRGYRGETDIDPAMLEKLPLFVQATVLEYVVDEMEVLRREGESPEDDEELAYFARCLERDIPWRGFFDPIYSSDAPFTLNAMPEDETPHEN